MLENYLRITLYRIVNNVCSVSGGDNVRADWRRAVHSAANGGGYGVQVGGRCVGAPGYIRRPHRAERIPVPGQQGRVPAYVTRC